MKIEEHETIEERLKYREPLSVKEIIVYKSGDAFSVCPKCGCSMEREYQSFCANCGQKLCWKSFYKAKVKCI